METANSLIYLSLVHLVMSLLLSIVVLYATFRIIKSKVIDKHDVPYTNMAFAILCAAILFSVAYLIADVKDPIVNTVRLLQRQSGMNMGFFMESARYIGLFLFIALVVIFTVIGSSFYLFSVMTSGIDELKEIKDENVAVSIIVSVIIISVSMIVKDSMLLLLEALMPYPEYPLVL
ncbi:MAG: DUF350 domain-containing protein [Flavobacteriales bacterium]|nr:DUF350 domain-containing protein [Flavobacteriales bacterium]